ncbi:MAG: PAS domain S-box protein [Cyanobacteria bacterium REEB67]|nr:PAS domain S-box protein [Cyanobacteria bacterium REEB67]
MSSKNDTTTPIADIASLVNTVEAIIWEADFATSRLSFVSGHVVELLGYPLQRWIDEPGLFAEICHPDDLPRIGRAKQLASVAEPGYEVIFRLRHADGHYLWMSDRVVVVFEANEPKLLRGVTTDVSERRRIEEALALVVEVIAEASELENIEDISLHCLTRICQLGGWLIGQAWFPSVEGQELKCSRLAFFSSVRSGAFREESLATTFEYGQGLPGQTAVSTFPIFVEDATVEARSTLTLLAANGVRSGFAFAVRNNQKVLAVFEFFGVSRVRPDKYFLNAIEEIGTHLAVVFERRIAKDLLSLQRAHEQIILDAIPALIFYKDRNNNIIRVNRAVSELHGYVPEEMVGLSCFDLYPDEAVQYFQDDLEVMNSGIAKLGIVEPLVTRGGTKHWVVTDKIPYRDEHGETVGVLCFCSDITELKRVEEELKAAHADLEDKVAARTRELNEANIFFTLSRDLFCISSVDGYFKKINFAWVDKTGYSEEELLSIPFLDLVHPDDREATIARMAILADGMPVANFENRYICKDGSIIWLLWSGTPNTAREYVYACAYDITDRKKTESEMFDISTALQNAVEGIAKVDINHCFLSANQSYASLHGINTEEIIDRSILDFVYSDDKAKFRKCFEDMLRQSKSEVELLGQTNEGDLFHEQVTLVKVINVNGDYDGYYIFNKDISARKVVEARLQQSEARFNQLAAHLPGGIYQYVRSRDGSHSFPYISPGFGNILAVKPAEVMANAAVVFDMMHRDEIDELMRRQTFCTETLCDFEYEGRVNTARGMRWVRINSSPELLENGDVLFNGLMTDITDKKQAEEEIKKLNQDLSERVENLASVNKELELLTRKLEIAFDAALEASKLKSEFVANISHEIRTPISAVIGMSELLLDTALTDEQKQFTNMVRDSAQSLLTIINDILDFSKVEAGRLDLEIVNFELLPMVEDSAELLAANARKKAINLLTLVDPSLPSALMGDPVRIRQILINLISNAVKFTREGQVFVKVEKLEEDEDTVTVRFHVSDTGIGISREARERLFNPFVQADGSTTRKYGGTGLGLSISKLLAEMMEGELDFTSREGRGSAFWFTAPMVKGLSASGAAPSVAESQTQMILLEGQREPVPVTVMTPSATVAEIVSCYLGCLSVTPHVVTKVSALPAAVALQDSGDRLFILDVDSAELDQESVDLISSLAALPAVHIIFLGHSEEALADFALPVEKERYYFLAKPFHLADLVSICARWALRSDTFTRQKVSGGAQRIVSEGKRLSAGKNQPLTPAFARVGNRDGAPQVLIAEDNNVMQEVAMRQLQKLGLRAEVVNNGIAAVEAVKSGNYALVFMDCQMPEMDGYEATLCIRKEEAVSGGHVPIIAMTASAMKGDRENCIAAGMDDYLSKPVNQEQLHLLLEKWLPALLPNVEQMQAMIKPNGGARAVVAESHIAQEKSAHRAAAGTIDFGALEKLYGQMDLPYLIDSFLIEAAQLTGELIVKLASADYPEVGRLAHQLKGLAVVMTAAHMAELAVELENEAKRHAHARADELSREIETELKVLTVLISERK